MNISLQKTLVVLCIGLFISACVSSDGEAPTISTADAGSVEGVATDAGAADAGSSGTGSIGAGFSFSGSADTGSTDTTSSDSGTSDSGSSDAISGDSGASDSGSGATGFTDTGSAENGSTAAGSTDTDTSDNGSADSGSTDMGSTDSESADSGTTVAELQVSCEVINVLTLVNNGGFVRTVLPADLSSPGAQISIQHMQIGQFTAFDASSGLVDYVPGSGRLPSTVTYQVSDADGVVLATHEHRWVFDMVRVMPLGDSITSGVEHFDGNIDQPVQAQRVGYRKFLYDQLVAAGYSIDYVGQAGQNAGAAAGLSDPQNNGYPGVDIAFIDSKLLEVLADDDTDIILLHIGTNNTPQNAAAIDALLVKLDTWETENHPVLALVATITPKRDAARNAEVDMFNQDLRSRIAARVDDNVILVEQNMALSLDDISTESIGLHPNAGGYQKMANAWFDVLTDPESTALENCSF